MRRRIDDGFGDWTEDLKEGVEEGISKAQEALDEAKEKISEPEANVPAVPQALVTGGQTATQQVRPATGLPSWLVAIGIGALILGGGYFISKLK